MINIRLQNYFIPYSPTPTEPWLTEASGNQGESRDVTWRPNRDRFNKEWGHGPIKVRVTVQTGQ